MKCHTLYVNKNKYCAVTLTSLLCIGRVGATFKKIYLQWIFSNKSKMIVALISSLITNTQMCILYLKTKEKSSTARNRKQTYAYKASNENITRHMMSHKTRQIQSLAHFGYKTSTWSLNTDLLFWTHLVRNSAKLSSSTYKAVFTLVKSIQSNVNLCKSRLTPLHFWSLNAREPVFYVE